MATFNFALRQKALNGCKDTYHVDVCVEDSVEHSWTVILPAEDMVYKWNTENCPVTAITEDVTSGLATYRGECLDGTSAPAQEIYNLQPEDIPVITGFLFITYASGYIAGLSIHAVRRITEAVF